MRNVMTTVPTIRVRLDRLGGEQEGATIMSTRRIESSASRTADMTCGCRAISYMESNALHKSDDWVAPKLLPRTLQILIRIPIARRFLSRLLGPQGIYEWVIARTKYIDEVFIHASAEGFSQVLLLGAGFDSRGVRFQSELKEAKVFELDAPTTQRAKIEQYQKRGIAVPANLVFVPINFERELIEDKLHEAGFCKGARTLAVLEGVTQYLRPEAIYSTLRTISNEVGKGSWLVFDYAHASVLKGESNAYGQDRMIKGVNKFGESWQFGLEEAEVEPLLTKYGFRLMERKSPHDLQETYFKDERGKILARVNGTQSIIMAQKT
jgi:methyltransferase (TIGR00027 family)